MPRGAGFLVKVGPVGGNPLTGFRTRERRSAARELAIVSLAGLASFLFMNHENLYLSGPFALSNAPIEATPGPEMASVFWVPLEALPATQGTSTVTTILGELIVPAFTYEGRLIWGFTYRILEELLVFVGLSA